MRLLFLTVAVALTVAACGDSGSDPAPQTGDAVDAPMTGASQGPTPDSSPTPEISVGSFPPPVSYDLRQEIADTLEGFSEAYFNGESLTLVTYWSEECAQEDIDLINENLVFFGDFIGGEADVLVDSDKLIIEEFGDGRVRIPADQPTGTVQMLVDGRPYPDAAAEEGGDDFVVVLEDGVWRVTGCDQFAANLQLNH